MEWIETTGATLDEAKERALDRLGVAEDEMEIEVLAEGARSIFGFRKTCPFGCQEARKTIQEALNTLPR